MRPTALSFFLGIFLSCFSLPLQAEDPLRIAVDAPYPPFAFLDDQGSLAGFDVDIARALCTEIKRDCEIKVVTFDEIIPGIVDEKIDIGIAGMEGTPERQKLVNFTDRYYRSHSIFLEKPGTIHTLSAEDMKGRKIGAKSGTSQETYLNEKYQGIVTVVTYPTFEELLQTLQDDQLDAVLVDGLPAYAYLKSAEGAELEPVGYPVKPSILVGSSHIAISKKQPKLTQQVNKALQTLRANGTYGRINRKYFDFDIY